MSWRWVGDARHFKLVARRIPALASSSPCPSILSSAGGLGLAVDIPCSSPPLSASFLSAAGGCHKSKLPTIPVGPTKHDTSCNLSSLFSLKPKTLIAATEDWPTCTSALSSCIAYSCQPTRSPFSRSLFSANSFICGLILAQDILPSTRRTKWSMGQPVEGQRGSQTASSAGSAARPAGVRRAHHGNNLASTPGGGGGIDARRFRLNESGAVLVVQRGDITKWSVNGETDAIVNAANERMLGGGGVDGAIHRAAGPSLLQLCREVPEVRPGVRCPTGEARVTRAGLLPVAFVIHTVGPIYRSEEASAPLLRSCYRHCLEAAQDSNVSHLCFPAISCGVYGYPYEKAAEVALSELQSAPENVQEVHFMLFEEQVYDAWVHFSERHFDASD